MSYACSPLISWLRIYVFVSEMRPCWYSFDEIPFKDMWPDDIDWFPLLLKGAKFSGYFKFEGHDKIIDFTLQEVDKLPE